MMLYTRDVQNFTGKSKRTCQRMIRDVLISKNRTTVKFVTVKEFCEFYGFDEEDIREFMVN